MVSCLSSLSGYISDTLYVWHNVYLDLISIGRNNIHIKAWNKTAVISDAVISETQNDDH